MNGFLDLILTSKGSIKKNVTYRIVIAGALLTVFILFTFFYTFRIGGGISDINKTAQLTEKVTRGEIDQSSWLNKIGMYLYADISLEGIKNDHKTCSVGELIYSGDIGINDSKILSLIDEMDKAHIEMHEAGKKAISIKNTSVDDKRYILKEDQK